MEYDSLIDEDPEVKERAARCKAEGEIKGLQRALVMVVEERFPPLVELARGKAARINTVETLIILLRSLAAAPDKDLAQLLLELLVV